MMTAKVRIFDLKWTAFDFWACGGQALMMVNTDRNVVPLDLFQFWRDRSLVSQFALAGGVVLLIAMVCCGLAVSSFVRTNVLNQRAAATVLFIDSVVTPQLQELATQRQMAPANKAVLDALMQKDQLGTRIPFLEIWLPDGTIAYSNSAELLGQQFALPAAADEAFLGRIVATFADLRAKEHITRHLQMPLIEIYSPVREYGSGRIIAVVEVHETPDVISGTLLDVSIRSWIAVALTCLAVAGSLFLIVKGGSDTIARQKQALSMRLREARELATQYQAMQVEAQRTSRTVTELNDRLMRDVGSDLHDGPSQLISFATLKVERARRARTESGREQELGDIEANLMRALDDIRNIAMGLLLPAIDNLDLGAVVGHAVDLHAKRTGETVSVDNSIGAIRAANAINVCVFRFVQEGLNNAFWHGRSGGTRVTAALSEDEVLTIQIVSRTASPSAGEPLADPQRERRNIRYGLGLKGLRARVQSLGGSLDFSIGELDACLSLSLDLREFMADA